MDTLWVRLGITDDDLGTSWSLPGDNLGMTKVVEVASFRPLADDT